jgi:hypothetical protein
MSLRVFLCGDVMTGRGIDQALPHPVDPVLYEPYVRDAREYVDLAEKAHGAFQRPVTFDYIWGETFKNSIAPMSISGSSIWRPLSHPRRRDGLAKKFTTGCIH